MRIVASKLNQKLPSLTKPLLSPPRSILLRFTQAVSLSSRSSKTLPPEERRSQDSCKTHVRFAVREKRSDSKSAVRSLLLNGRSVQGDSERTQRQKKLKARLSSSTKEKCWQKRKGQDAKGSFTWAWAGETFTFGNSNSNSTGFEWRDESNWNQNQKKYLNESDLEEEGEEEWRSKLDLTVHRIALELPRTGPLNIDRVKSAFRLAALKWHPDKHQGASKGFAEEKFKQCVDAYTALSRSVTKP
ncbi:hypothetical protein LUZ60_013473 [Juncus effusus]|nr:hypothetical protein LUZ60_013473 [Juncus effusus]